MIRHHVDPMASKQVWSRDMAQLLPAPWIEAIDFVIQSDQREMERQNQTIDIVPIALNDQEIEELEAFLRSLTGQTRNDRPLGRPARVPSNLPVD
jgi:cytochrome c peroxidase